VSEELASLYDIQQADTEIARHEEALSDLDAGADLAAEIETLEGELADLRKKLEEAENENLDRELEAKTLEEKRKRFQDQLYGGSVRNPRQLTDLHQEVEMLGREIGKLEDRMLELMELLESLRAGISSREQRLAGAETQLEAVRAEYERKGGRLRDRIAELKAERRERAARVGPRLLKRYEQIRGRAGNVGLVKVTGRNCLGCMIDLPQETVKALRAGRSGLTCDNCGRLLLWGEGGEAEQ
jgi:predicted  nucleic acid-binding Zn-ribbon protein